MKRGIFARMFAPRAPKAQMDKRGLHPQQRAYVKGVEAVEDVVVRVPPGTDEFDVMITELLSAAEAAPDASGEAELQGVVDAVNHLAQEGHGEVVVNPRKLTPKMKAAQDRSRTVLKRAHAILASRGCSFKEAMVQAWSESKVKTNSPTRMTDLLWAKAYDGEEAARFEMARSGRAYNVPNMYAASNPRRTRKNVSLPSRGTTLLWARAFDGNNAEMYEMARQGLDYNVPNMGSTGRMHMNPGLKKGQSLMKAAAKRYRAGEFSSMQEAVSAVAAERRRR